MNQHTLILCPSCSCHARREERKCPHCGAPLTLQAGAATQRSVVAVAMGLSLAVALPLAGCSEAVGGGSSGQGGSGVNGTGPNGRGGDGGAIASGGDGGTIASPSGSGGSTSSDGGYGSSVVTVTQAVTTYGVAVTTGGEECDDQTVFADPICETCMDTACCRETEPCHLDYSSCFDAKGQIDSSSTVGAALEACLLDYCETECSGMCETGLTFGDPEMEACLDPACCVELVTCLGAGQNVCLDCLSDHLGSQGAEEPGAVCADLVGCGEAGGCFD